MQPSLIILPSSSLGECENAAAECLLERLYAHEVIIAGVALPPHGRDLQQSETNTDVRLRATNADLGLVHVFLGETHGVYCGEMSTWCYLST